jgi:hypothetical protein
MVSIINKLHKFLKSYAPTALKARRGGTPYGEREVR